MLGDIEHVPQQDIIRGRRRAAVIPHHVPGHKKPFRIHRVDFGDFDFKIHRLKRQSMLLCDRKCFIFGNEPAKNPRAVNHAFGRVKTIHPHLPITDFFPAAFLFDLLLKRFIKTRHGLVNFHGGVA